MKYLIITVAGIAAVGAVLFALAGGRSQVVDHEKESASPVSSPLTRPAPPSPTPSIATATPSPELVERLAALERRVADLEARLAVVEAVRPSGVGAGNGADDADHAADDPEIEARFKAEATGVFEGENAPPEALPPAPAEDPEQEDSKDPDKAKAYNVNVGADFDPAVAEPAEDGPK